MTSMAMTPHLSETTFLPSSFVLPLLTTSRSVRLAAFLHAIYGKHFSESSLKIWISTRRAKVYIFSEIWIHVFHFCQRIVYRHLYFSTCESENTLMSCFPFTNFSSLCTVSNGNMSPVYFYKLGLIYPFILQGIIWKWYHLGVSCR